MLDITATGELLIDFTPCKNGNSSKNTYEQNPGGAPGNVLAMATKLGSKTQFIGKVGNDSFGHFLSDALKDCGVGTEGLVISDEYNTTLAFVSLDEKGDRSFSFCRKQGADAKLTIDELNYSVIDDCKIFHFGSVSLTADPSKSTTLEAVNYAKSKSKIISYDPNYRPFLWDNEKYAVETILQPMHNADIVKVSLEELQLLTGEEDISLGCDKILDFGVSIVFISLGADGAFFATRNHRDTLPTFQNVKTIDTTGAGDAFFGTILHTLAKYSLDEIKNLSYDSLVQLVTLANAAGSLTTTNFGAIPSLPDLESINKLISDR